MDWYPRYPRRYRADTLKLSLAAHGAYGLLIDWYMDNEQAPPDDDAALAKIVGCTAKEWAKVGPELRPYFKVKKGCLTLKRCEAELRARKSRSKRRTHSASTAARSRWKKSKKNDPEKPKGDNVLDATRIATASHTHNSGHAIGMRFDATGQDRTEETPLVPDTTVGVSSVNTESDRPTARAEKTTEHDGGLALPSGGPPSPPSEAVGSATAKTTNAPILSDDQREDLERVKRVMAGSSS